MIDFTAFIDGDWKMVGWLTCDASAGEIECCDQCARARRMRLNIPDDDLSAWRRVHAAHTFRITPEEADGDGRTVR